MYKAGNGQHIYNFVRQFFAHYEWYDIGTDRNYFQTNLVSEQFDIAIGKTALQLCEDI